ncbi:hypothetical protein EW146_g4001 [Bondarzewia mesenterica]|uniref:Peptidase A1 domain-containing protein n=1 Tax=Bondarzewia mesenterica TaxID=1095465 RepID=A0A4S4LY14_9AGAM|nr:hypothetical protein EW146_g4001 [Bondarzewia mesenterica]
MKRASLLQLALAAIIALPSLAFKLPIQVQRRASVPSSKGFKAMISYSYPKGGDEGNVGILNSGNNLYMANITIAGEELMVQIDTGSTDLWVFPETSLNNITFSNAGPVNETYGSGSVQGPVAFASFSIGNYSVSSQSFVNVTNFTVFDQTLFPLGARGIFGLAFNEFGSPVTDSVAAANNNNRELGQNAVANIFQQKPNLPNFISIQLGRAGDLEDTAEGAFSISEYLEGFESIADEPRHNRFVPPGQGERWGILVETVSVNGTSMTLNSSMDGVPAGSAVAVLDTGATDAQIPASVANFIYSSIPDAFFADSLGLWITPCTATVDVRFTFEGQEVAIHPLDLTTAQAVTLNASADSVRTVCFGNYQPVSINIPGFDLLMGDSFLRNVYALFDYGVEDSNGKVSEDPFIQLLPLSDPKEAEKDFFKNRLSALSQMPPEATPDEIRQALQATNSTGSSNSTSFTSSSSSKSSSSDSSSSSSKGSNSLQNAVSTGSDSSDSMSTLVDHVDKWGLVIVGLLSGNLVIGIIVCIVGVSICVRRGGRAGARIVSPSYVPVRFKEDSGIREDEVIAGKYSD